MGDLLGQLLERPGALAERCDRNARKNREHNDLQDLVIGHGFNDGLRHQVGDELLQREARSLEIGG